jgi:hypothetical protein
VVQASLWSRRTRSGVSSERPGPYPVPECFDSGGRPLDHGGPGLHSGASSPGGVVRNLDRGEKVPEGNSGQRPVRMRLATGWEESFCGTHRVRPEHTLVSALR